jgi:hypothetical protein
MGQGDDLVTAVSQIHAAALDAAKWPDALSSFTQLMGGHGASLEFIERPSLQHRAMYSYGLPAVGPYLQQYAPMCPRIPYAARSPAGAVQHDAQYIDDQAMDASPFFMEFLAQYDMRYFIGGIVANSAQELVLTGVQISPKAGHPSPAKIKLMGLLLPHFQQAAEVMRRLGSSQTRSIRSSAPSTGSQTASSCWGRTAPCATPTPPHRRLPARAKASPSAAA